MKGEDALMREGQRVERFARTGGDGGVDLGHRNARAHMGEIEPIEAKHDDCGERLSLLQRQVREAVGDKSVALFVNRRGTRQYVIVTLQ